MHPLMNGDLSYLTDQQLEEKIQEMSRRYFQAMRFSPSVLHQVVLILDTYKLEREERQMAKLRKEAETGENEFNDLIKVD